MTNIDFVQTLVAAGGMTFLAGISLGMLFGLYLAQRNHKEK